MKFPEKKIMVATWGCEEKDHYQYLEWIPYFKENFGKVVVFSPRSAYFKEGKREMNKMFLEKLKNEKPDYCVFCLNYDEFYPETLEMVKKVSPETITMNFFGDDDWRYDDWTRHYAPFFDYILVAEKGIEGYEKDGIKDITFFHGSSTRVFYPIDTEKKYDVSFIGMPISDRGEYLRFLRDNGINIKLFGKGWEGYGLDDIYGGYLNTDEYLRVLNQSKINLSFSKGALPGSKGGQLKGRVLECALCKAFLLVEHTERNIGPFADRNINFKDKKELLEKVRYFLKNEKEREGFAKKSYDFVIKNLTWEAMFDKLFNNIKRVKRNLPSSDKKIVVLSENDFNKGIDYIKEKTEKMDYISLRTENGQHFRAKNRFQAYSLDKSGKDISCCDYYAHSKNIGDYLFFMTKKAYYNIKGIDFHNMVYPDQLMFTKGYFDKNILNMKDIIERKKIPIINDKNTIFVSIPLVRINKFKGASYDAMKKGCRMLFLDRAYSLLSKKRASLFYPALIIESLFYGRGFILRHIRDSILNKNLWTRLKVSFS